MSEDQRKALEMLASNKINADEASRLLSVAEPEGSTPEDTPKATRARITKSQYLRLCAVPGVHRF
jgi:hypothetical protein